MPSRIIHATHDASGYHFLVHLDTEMTVGTHEAHELSLPVGAPHPYFLRKWDFSNLTPGVHVDHKGQTITEEAYHDSIEAMLKEQIANELQGVRFYQPAPKPHAVMDRFHGKEL